jgi:hypothetical protein
MSGTRGQSFVLMAGTMTRPGPPLGMSSLGPASPRFSPPEPEVTYSLDLDRGLRDWWMILEMSIGNRWPRPGQAAVGALDHVPVGDWPGLAARWLALGFDSEPLRQLARLRSWETGAALALMPEALRSIGFDPAPAEEEFTARCQAALDIVQRDLDATGYGRYRVRAYLTQWPTTVFAALPDGSYWSGAWGMTREMHGASLLFTAAASVSGTIKEVDEIDWPVCAADGEEPVALSDDFVLDEPVTLIDGVPWWWCIRARHALAPVGQLTARIARTP